MDTWTRRHQDISTQAHYNLAIFTQGHFNLGRFDRRRKKNVKIKSFLFKIRVEMDVTFIQQYWPGKSVGRFEIVRLPLGFENDRYEVP